MIGIIIVTHGKLGEGLIQSVQSIVGHQDHVGVISIQPHDSLAEIRSQCRELYTKLHNDNGVLILTDILGGTSCNASLPLIKQNVAVLTGVNLPMLMVAFLHRKHSTLDQLAVKVLEEGKKSIINAKEMLLKRLE